MRNVSNGSCGHGEAAGALGLSPSCRLCLLSVPSSGQSCIDEHFFSKKIATVDPWTTQVWAVRIHLYGDVDTVILQVPHIRGCWTRGCGGAASLYGEADHTLYPDFPLALMPTSVKVHCISTQRCWHWLVAPLPNLTWEEGSLVSWVDPLDCGCPKGGSRCIASIQHTVWPVDLGKHLRNECPHHF